MKCSAIEWIARFGRDPFMLLIALIAGLGTAHILVRTATYGAAVTPYDSIHFLSTALNFLAGEGWRDFWGFPLVGWPPLFPLLLAAGGWVGLDPLEVGRWVNATAFGLTILAAGGWLRSHLRSRGLGLAATAAIAVSLPLSEFASRFMTDALFVLFTLLALIQLTSFLNRRTDAPLWWAAVFAALAALTRYPGVVLIGTGVLLVLVRRTPPLAVRLKDAVVFGAVSSLPLAAVLTRNWAVSETLTDERDGPGRSLSDSLSQVADVFREWVIPLNALDESGYLLWPAAGLVVAVGMVVVVSGRGLGMGAERTAPPLLGLGPAIPFGGFAVGYLGFMITVVPFVVYQGIDSRYLLPVYVPLLLTAGLLLDRFLSIEAASRMDAVRSVLASLILLGALAHTGLSAHRNLRITRQAWKAGFESWTLNGSYWEPSETLNYIRTHLSEGKIYSNNAELAWFWDGTAALGKHQSLPGRINKVIPRIMRRTDGTSSHIVWLQNQKFSCDYDDIDLRCLPGVEPVAELSDGVVFRLTTAATEPFDADRHRARRQRYLDQLLAQVGERVVRADWDIYLGEGKLTYLKEPCTRADTQAKFVLHVTPADPGVLSRSRQRYGFDNLGFYFDRRGVRRGNQCMVIVHLPDYPIGRIRVGQWISRENRTLWDAEFAGAGD